MKWMLSLSRSGLSLVLSFAALLAIAGTLAAQTTVRIEMPPCNQRMEVFGLNGTGYVRVTSLRPQRKTETLPDGTTQEKQFYVWEAPNRSPAVYYIGSSMRSYVPVVVGADPQVTITAECKKIRQATVSGSSLNQSFGQVRQMLKANNIAFSRINQQLSQARKDGDPAAIEAQTAAMRELDNKRQAYLAEVTAQDPFLGRIAAVGTYLSSVSAPDGGGSANEAEHYVNTFWQNIDFNDPGYNGLNSLYEAAVGYAGTLAQVAEAGQAEQKLNELIDRWPAGSQARFYVLGGSFNGLNQRNSPAALPIGRRLVEEYKASEPKAVATVEAAFGKLVTSTPGAEAPNLVGPNPEGETISLKELRGKVVLLDFWASWCGPCRRENPRVKALYDRYADRGFEILGVSLDGNKDRWIKAIADDKLNWLHMSDLKKWKSAHAALYGVRSIPDTILLDAEGKIIARGLRGEQLEAKLAEIFAGK